MMRMIIMMKKEKMMMQMMMMKKNMMMTMNVMIVVVRKRSAPIAKRPILGLTMTMYPINKFKNSHDCLNRATNSEKARRK